MAGFVEVGLSIACGLLLVSLIGPVVAPQLQPILGITVDVTPLVFYFFIFATIYNSVLLTTIALRDRKKSLEKEAQDHVFTFMIPCRNEEPVIEKTVKALMDVNYPTDMFEALVINDYSTDQTSVLAEKMIKQYPNLRILHISQKESGRGKSAVLNKGFTYLQRISKFKDNPNWIIGVCDADGIPDEDILKKASHCFNDLKIGAVQVLVRISNSKSSILTMLQDIEFVTFAKVTQSSRAIFKGAVALGGNGQFIRAQTLKEVALAEEEYWRNEALTEDLDLGTRVLLKGWENSFLSSTAIHQQGVSTLGALYKQRTRWSWGSLQCFLNYVPNLKVLKHKIGVTKKLDLIYYLSATLLPPMVLLVWILSILALTGLIGVYSPFPTYFLIANSISFFPLIGYGLWTVRNEYKPRMMIPLLLLTNAYSYHWVLCTVAAMGRILRRKKPQWAKTEKLETKYASENKD
jgi:1,2-diacylglycerol 3-beta-glucosyltransferase